MQVSSIQNNKISSPNFRGKVMVTDYKTRKGSSYNIPGLDDKKLYDCFVKLKKQCVQNVQAIVKAEQCDYKALLASYVDKLFEITNDKFIKELTMPTEQKASSVLVSKPTFSIFNAGSAYTAVKTENFEIVHDLTF